jgi:hypothetical protein
MSFSKLSFASISLIAILLLGIGRTFACGSWVIVSPQAPGSFSDLYGVAAVSMNNVWAVGERGEGNGIPSTLIEQYNGGGWSIIASPNQGTSSNILYGLAMVSTTSLWAVGFYNNTTLNQDQTLVEHWDGTRWSIVPSPNVGASGNLLYGVDAISDRDIWAVGVRNAHTLIEHYNGTNWNVISSPNPLGSGSALKEVAASSSKDVWAVGSYLNSIGFQQTLIEHYDGTHWSIVPSPNPGSNQLLSGIVHISQSSTFWAVGHYMPNATGAPEQTLIIKYNGTQWVDVTSPNVGTNSNELSAVAAASNSDLWAIGNYYNDSLVPPAHQTLTEHYDGTRWTIVSSPDVGTTDNFLWTATHIPGSSQFWAAGFYTDAASGLNRPLAEYYC